jgi:hypothetical protein
VLVGAVVPAYGVAHGEPADGLYEFAVRLGSSSGNYSGGLVSPDGEDGDGEDRDGDADHRNGQG